MSNANLIAEARRNAPESVDESLIMRLVIALEEAEPRVITTVGGLSALHEGAYGLDADGLLWKIEGVTCSWINIEEGESESYRDDDIKLPFTLLGLDTEPTT